MSRWLRRLSSSDGRVFSQAVTSAVSLSALFCKELKTRQDTDSSLKRFQTAWQKKLGRSIGDVRPWSTLREAEKLRHCILHAAGRVALSRGEKDLEKIVAKEAGVTIKEGRICISEVYLTKVANAISELIEVNPLNRILAETPIESDSERKSQTKKPPFS